MNGKKHNEGIASLGIGAALAVLLILLDQVTKYLAVRILKGGPAFVLIPGVFELRYLENHGAAFGMLQGRRLFLLAISIVMIIAVAYAYAKLPIERRYFALRGICVAIFSGAAGNLIDRIRLGYVIDFFYFSLINFPIFNVADIYVTCSAALFFVLFLFYYKEEDAERLSKCLFHRGGRE